MNWLLLIQLLAKQLAPLGVSALQALAAKTTNPLELAAINEAIAVLQTFESTNPITPTPPKRFGRGLHPTPRHKLAGATPYRPTVEHLAVVPSCFLTLPSIMDILGNGTYGNCVSAEEGASKMGFSIWGQVGVPPAITITAQTVVEWARGNGWLNGADLPPVMTQMQSEGMQATNGVSYTDGAHTAVDYSNDTILRAAIVQGPVKIGIAANQLEHALNQSNGGSGWVLAGAQNDQNEDHCVALWGFGTIADLVKLFAAGGVTANVPSGVNTSTLAYALYTWGTVGIIDQPSLLNMVGEAWLRTPTTNGVTPPTPTPVPGPNPTPTPSPSPSPTPVPIPPAPVVGYTGSFIAGGPFSHHTVNVANGLVTSIQ